MRLELQADCYAGAWFKHATEDPDSPISEVSKDDLNRAADAASAVGDDRIQEKTQGQVNPESWTHGSAEPTAEVAVARVHHRRPERLRHLRRRRPLSLLGSADVSGNKCPPTSSPVAECHTACWREASRDRMVRT